MKLIGRWLKITARPSKGQLAIEEVSTAGAVEDDELITGLQHEIRRNYASSRELAQVLHDFGAGRLATYVQDNKLPTKQIIRHGEFGEIVGGALFRRVKRYCIPIMKLRHKLGRNQPTHLADVLAFRLCMSPPVVAVLEVKTRTTRSLGIGEEAYGQLTRTMKDGLGQALTFTYAKVAETNPTLASRIAPLLDDGTARSVELHIVIVHDDAAWRDGILTRLAKAATGAVSATIIRVPALAGLVERVYAPSRQVDTEEDVQHVA